MIVNNRNVFRVLLCMITLVMPFHFNLTNFLIILLTISWIFEGNIKYRLDRLRSEPLIVIFILFYLLFCFGLFYSSNIKVGFFNLEKKFSLFILPLVLGTSKQFGSKERQLVVISFLITCGVATLISLVMACFRYFESGDMNVFLHEELSSLIDFHPPYFAMYLAFAIIILINGFFSEEIVSGIRKYLYAFLVLYFFLFVILLSARTVTVFLLLLLVISPLYFSYKKGKPIYGLLFAGFVVIITVSIVLSSDYLKDRVIRPITSDINVIDGGGETGLSIRIVKWRCSLKGIKDYPLFGVGTGDAVDFLVSCYEKENFWGMYPQYRFNSHNQFLETGLTLGILGLTFFIICLALPVVKALKTHNNLMLAFVLLVGFCCLTESLLERQWGIVFFTFFISILYFDTNTNEEKCIESKI